MKKRQDIPSTAASTPPAKIQRTKPKVHQSDLEAQNEELLQVRDMLEESRDRYIDFYDFSPVGYLTLSHKALITEINLTGAMMLGEERSNLRRRRFAEFLALEDNDFWNRHFMAARQHEGRLTCELCLLRGDGSRIDVQIDSLRLARDSQEPVVRLALTDITERKRSEAALRASEAQRRLLEQQKIIQTSLDGFWVARAKDARILETNEAFCTMVGYAREELLTMCIFDLEADESSVETADHIKKIMDVGYDRFETRHRHKQGHLIDLEVSVSYSESDGGVNFVFVRDITERKRAEALLMQREREFRTLAEGMPDNIVRYNREGVTVYVNPVLERTLGDRAAAMLGTTPREYHPDGSYEDYAQLLDTVLASGEAGEIEKILPAPDGKDSVHQIRMVPERGENGEVLGVLSIGRDITERKRMEESLVSRERELRALTESSPGMMGSFYLRPDGSMCMPYVTSKIWEHFGLTPQEVAIDATPLLARTHPDDAQMVQDSIAESARSLTTWHKEYRILHPTKGERWMESNTNPEPHPDGGVIWYGNVHDITERKVAEEALRASEQQFRTLAENMPFILVRYDREGCRTYVNPSAERSFGFLGEQVIGKTLPEINPLRIPTVEAYQRALKHTLTTGERSEFEMQVSLASGDVRIGNTVIVAERDANGEICGAITIGRDITQLKQAEQQLRELTTHLQTVREEEKSHLAREIHDDLGSTLAALNLKISLLLDFELTEEMKKTSLLERLESLVPLVENAVAATRRIISGMRPDVLDNLGLFEALKWQADQFHQHTGIGCSVVCVNDHGCANCKECEYQLDETLSINLFRVFQEALSNVARHSGATKVEAEYQPGNGEVLLSVSDNGCGLPEGHNSASTSFGIRGMRERIGQLGGDIRFNAPPGGGLRVAVRVPLVAVDKIN